jgi:hypothetical protein
MVLGIISAIVAAPAIVGTSEAIRYGQKQNNRSEHRQKKHNLEVTLLKRSTYSPRFERAKIVLKDNKFYVDTRRDARDEYHPATTYYMDYPGKKEVWKKTGFAGGQGLVTTINDERFLNWVYMDKKTHEVKYGVKVEAQDHVVGPWDCTKIEHRMTLQGWEGFIAVQEEDGDEMWAVYFDANDDGLTGEGQVGNRRKRMLELEVWRKEQRRDYDEAMSERVERMQAREELDKTVD